MFLTGVIHALDKCLYVHHFNIIVIYIYTGCNRRNGPDLGRVFLRSNYTDITKTPISKVERLQRYWPEKRVDFFGVCVLYLFP